jgi:hypothetical protein
MWIPFQELSLKFIWVIECTVAISRISSYLISIVTFPIQTTYDIHPWSDSFYFNSNLSLCHQIAFMYHTHLLGFLYYCSYSTDSWPWFNSWLNLYNFHQGCLPFTSPSVLYKIIIRWYTGSHGCEDIDGGLLCCDAVRTCRQVPTFREDGGNMFLQNVGTYLQVHAVSQLKIKKFSRLEEHP